MALSRERAIVSSARRSVCWSERQPEGKGAHSLKQAGSVAFSRESAMISDASPSPHWSERQPQGESEHRLKQGASEGP